MKYDVVIVGAGLGGLLCANFLSREGLNVCLLEKNRMIGGSIQSFAKNKTIFNTGLNYTEGLGDGEILNRYFSYAKIMDKIKVKQMDVNGFERICFDGDPYEYPFAQGHENFVENLSQYFPEERQNLQRYISNLAEICHQFPYYTLEKAQGKASIEKLSISAHQFLQSSTQNKKLQEILAGMSFLYGGVKDKTPLYVHALINYTFIKSAWRIVDGSSQIAARIAEVAKVNGATIIRNAEVVAFRGKAKLIEYAELADGERIYADKFISNMHPAVTLDKVDDSINKKLYKQRISSLTNTVGMFTLYIVLKENSFPHINYNHHQYKEVNVWTAEYDEAKWPEHYMLYTPSVSQESKWAKGLVILSYMKYDEVKQWENTFLENRGDDYLAFKEHKKEQLLNYVEKRFPDIRKKIKHCYVSTPLSYRDYTGTPQGSSYGILKDYKDLYSSIITPRSRIKNLYFTGQNLNMHGILGVTISAVLTASEVIGQDYLIDKIRNA